MRTYLKNVMGTEFIDKIDYNELKAKMEGEHMLPRIKHRKNVTGMNGRKQVIAKG